MTGTALVKPGCAAMFAVGLLGAAGARADIVLSYDLAGAHLVYDASTMQLTVRDDDFSSLRILKEDSSSQAVLDSALIDNGGSNRFDFVVSLNMADLTGPNNWSATGTVNWTDLDQSSQAVTANFTSSSVLIDPGTRSLQITGTLSPVSGTTLLVNRGDPWTFDGSASFHGSNEDGVAGNLFINDPLFYGSGSLTTLKFGLDPALNLDLLFGENREFFNGNVKGAIIPAPPAVLLGAIGVAGVLHWRKRGCAKVA